MSNMIADESTYIIRICLAGINIEIECACRRGFFACGNYLTKFEKPDFSVRASKQHVQKMLANIVGEEKLINNGDDNNIEMGSLESFAINQLIIQKMIDFNVILIHGSVVAYEGMAYMFSAPSGIGKTTRTKIWLCEYPESFVVNGDKPLIKIESSRVLACGSPWCGSEGWNTNAMVPLRAIFFLERADRNGTSTIEEISIGKAFPLLLQQTYRPSDPDLMRTTIQLLKFLEGKVKFYKFCSTPTVEAVRLAYETARPR